MASKFEFSWEKDAYQTSTLESRMRKGNTDEISAMRKEYSRMRDTAQKRIQRLSKSDYTDSKLYSEYKSGFQKLKDIDTRDLPKAIHDIYKFLSAKGSTVSGQSSIMNKTITQWNKQGLNLNKKNYHLVMQMMDEMRSKKILYGSDKVVETADAILEKKLPSKTINKLIDDGLPDLLKNSDELSDSWQVVSRTATADEFLKLLGE